MYIVGKNKKIECFKIVDLTLKVLPKKLEAFRSSHSIQDELMMSNQINTLTINCIKIQTKCHLPGIDVSGMSFLIALQGSHIDPQTKTSPVGHQGLQ
jgi:hypothetical protein